MKQLFKLIMASIIMIITINSQAFAQGTHAGKAIKNASAAGSHASQSAAHSIAATGQVVSGIIAVPLMSAGAVGGVSARMGEELRDAANAPATGPLEISDETVTTGPAPDQAIFPKDI